ncbi:MAG: MFS transporter [Alphaproteobacteria bacterium]|nr:MFS transporter [Alphaproteobacteria bacterium]
MSASAAAPKRLGDHPAFRYFWTARVLTSSGFQVAGVVVGWKVYADTGSAFALGLVGLFQFMPMLLLTFVVGSVADRFDRRRIVMACQAVECVTLATLAAGIIGGFLTVQGIFVAVVVLGGARAFESPTLTSILPAVVPPSILPRATAVSSSAMQSATIVAPSLAGLLYAIGPEVALGLGSACYFAALLAMSLIRLERPPSTRQPVTLVSIFSGVAFIWSRKIILGAISLDMFAVLLGGITALLPIFAQDVLRVGPWGLGMLRSMPAVGAVAMSLILARVDLQPGVGRKMFAAVIVFGIATVVFSASTNIVLSCLALVALGAADNVSVVVRNSLVQLLTPDEMRGRVNSVNALFIGTSNQLGEFEAGMVAGLIGAVPAGIVGGVGTILVALLWMCLFPALRRAQRFVE